MARSAPRRGGCLIAVGVVILAVVVPLVAVVAIASSSSGPTPAPGTWATATEEQFEAACRSTGGDEDGCRCVRIQTEQRFTEQQLDDLVAGKQRGDAPSDRVQPDLRAAEAACGAG